MLESGPLYPITPERTLERAGSGLEKLMTGSLRRTPRSETPLLAWPLVCGSAVAERTRAVRFANSILSVAVPDAGWKHEMQNLAPRYIAAINRYTMQPVHRIDFVIRQGN